MSGILASGGSAFWNHLLDILQAAKVQKENLAYGTGSGAALNAANVPVVAVAAITTTGE